MALKHILGIFALLFFVFCFHNSENKKRCYLIFSICLIPLIDLHITPPNLGTLTVFDGMSLYVLPFLFKQVISDLNYKKPFFLIFSLMSIAIIIGCLKSEFFIFSLISYFKFITIFIYAKLLIEELNKDSCFVNEVIKYFRYVVIFGLLFITIQYFVGLDFTYWDLNQNTLAGDSIRYPGFSPDPQVFSQFLGMSIFLFLIRLRGETNKDVMYSRIVGLLILIAIFFTGGRSGLLGLCVGIGIVILTSNNRLRLLALCVGITVYFTAIYFPDYFIIFNRAENVKDSYEVRAKIWNEAITIFKTSPYFGVGLDSYQPLVMKYYNFGYYINDGTIVNYGTENGYLKMLVEMGVFGFLLSLCFILIPVIGGIRKYIKRQVNNNIFVLIAIVAAWGTAFLTSTTLEHNTVAILLATVLCILISSHPENSTNVS